MLALRSATRSAVRVGGLARRSLSTLFTPEHEWISIEGGVGTIGITDFAQKALGDVVFVELPEEGDEFSKG